MIFLTRKVFFCDPQGLFFDPQVSTRGVSLAMANPFQFIQEVRAEADKVTWPTRRETLITTGLVILMVLFAALFFVAVDQGLRFFVTLILSIGH